MNNCVIAVAIGPAHNTDILEIGVCGRVGGRTRMNCPTFVFNFIKTVFIDVIWRDRKYYKDWIFEVNLFMMKKNQAEKKEMSILLYILNDKCL